jgi:hypothetical protein
MVALDAVVVLIEDEVGDEARITPSRPMQKGKVFAPTLAPMCLTMVRNLQQTRCELHGRR